MRTIYVFFGVLLCFSNITISAQEDIGQKGLSESLNFHSQVPIDDWTDIARSESGVGWRPDNLAIFKKISGSETEFAPATTEYSYHNSFESRVTAEQPLPVSDPGNSPADDGDPIVYPISSGFRWGPAIRQSVLFLGIQHGYAMTQPKTRESLKGPFLKDYARSVKSLSGWGDGGRFFTNYIAHPMQGSLTGFIHVQNDPRGMNQTFGRSREYWKSRMKAFAWSAAWSTQFEIGPISQASIGNVGLDGKQTYVDIVITPTGGIAMLIAEDILDKYLIRKFESWTGNRFILMVSRTLLNPTRSSANLIRFKPPWHRDELLRF